MNKTYESIWFVFENEFSMSYKQIQNLVKCTLEEHFKMKDVTPIK